MLTFKYLKIELLKKNIKFIELVRKDGRSYQYLHKKCSNNDQKILLHLLELLNKF